MGFGADLLKKTAEIGIRTPVSGKLLPVCPTNDRRRCDHISELHAKFGQNLKELWTVSVLAVLAPHRADISSD